MADLGNVLKSLAVDALPAGRLNALITRNLERQHGGGLRERLSTDPLIAQATSRSAVMDFQNFGLHGFHLVQSPEQGRQVAYYPGEEAVRKWWDAPARRWTCTTHCWLEEAVVREMIKEMMERQAQRADARRLHLPEEQVRLIGVTVPQRAWWQRRVPEPTDGSPKYRVTASGENWLFDMMNIVEILNNVLDDLDFTVTVL